MLIPIYWMNILFILLSCQNLFLFDHPAEVDYEEE
jgi:hypothetical protein